MIGKDFQHTGKPRNISHRVGDGNGSPFVGPVKVCSLRRGVIAVLTKDQSIVIHQLRGITEHIYYPISAKAAVLNRRSVRNLLKLIEESEQGEEQLVEGDNKEGSVAIGNSEQAQSLDENEAENASEREEESEEEGDFESDISAPFTFLDMHPLSMSPVEGKNALVITDCRFCVHILDLDEHRIVHTFGSGGTGMGEFVKPSAVHTALLHTSLDSADPPRLYYFIGDSQITQKVRIFDQECIQLAEVGGMGPRKGQFNNIVSISCYDPFLTNSVKTPNVVRSVSTVPANTQPSMALIPYLDDTDSDAGISITGAAGENTPAWYRGEQSIEDLEAMMYADDFKGNFLMALDKPFEYPGDEQLLLTDGEKSSKKYMTAQNSLNTVYMEKMYNILYITQQQRLGHIVVKESTNPAYGVGFYIYNHNDLNRVYYECIYDLLHAQKECKFTLGGDSRKYAYVSVCDQGNYRVQIFRFYWTKSIIYKPELKLAYVIGGMHRKYVELFDPVSVAYTPTGELAICDSGSCKVHLLSPTMQPIQRIALPFISINDLPITIPVVRKSDTMKDNKNATKHKKVVSLRSANKENGAETSPEKPISTAAGACTLTDRELHTAGLDYMQYLSSSLASYINFNEREKRGDPPPTRRKKKFTRGTATSSTFTNSSLLPITITNTSNTITNSDIIAGNNMQIVKLSALKSTKRASFGTTNNTFSTGANQNTYTTDITATATDSILTISEPSARAQSAVGEKVAFSDPTLLAAQRRRRANRTPCAVSYSAEGQLLVGYKNGGVYAFSPYDIYAMGLLEKLPITALETTLQYLSYPDIESLRNCCLYLHNLTKDMRLTWRLFPAERKRFETRLVSVFLECAKLDMEGFEKPDFVLRDESLNAICARHLKLECDNAFCPDSHQPLCYDRAELAQQAGYIVYADFIHALSVVFGPKFLWKYELYIEKLYEAFGVNQQVVIRHDNMTRKNETVRAKHVESVRVLRFLSYLEVMALLEEQYSDLKSIHAHKLFCHMPRHHYVPKVDYALFNIDKRMVIDPCEQYDRPINVPYKKMKGVKLITLKGMENAQRSRPSAVAEHTAVFECHADKAADLINKLFS